MHKLLKTGCRILTFVLTFSGGENSNLYRLFSSEIHNSLASAHVQLGAAEYFYIAFN